MDKKEELKHEFIMLLNELKRTRARVKTVSSFSNHVTSGMEREARSSVLEAVSSLEVARDFYCFMERNKQLDKSNAVNLEDEFIDIFVIVLLNYKLDIEDLYKLINCPQNDIDKTLEPLFMVMLTIFIEVSNSFNAGKNSLSSWSYAIDAKYWAGVLSSELVKLELESSSENLLESSTAERIRSLMAKKAAHERHAETYALKNEVHEYWLNNIDKELSNKKAADRLVKQFPLQWTTLRDYVSEFKK